MELKNIVIVVLLFFTVDFAHGVIKRFDFCGNNKIFEFY